MSYQVKKRGQGWRLVWVEWSSKGKAQSWKHIRKEAYPALGFSASMSYEDAKAYAKSINADAAAKSLERRKQRTVQRIATENLNALKNLPMCAVFEDVQIPKMSVRSSAYWRAAKRCIADVNLEPQRWYRNSQDIYTYFARNKYSPSYSKKVIGVMNAYLDFLIDRTERAYMKVPAPRGRHRERIADAYYDSDKVIKESKPLSVETLHILKEKLSSPAQYNYMHVSLWLGLRPIEVRNSVRGMKFFTVSEESGYTIANVYQSKLIGIPKEKRWKKIPILFEEQREALRYIAEGAIEEPLVKTIQRALGAGFTCYAGRKGFEALMRARGRSIMEVQAWLGHRSIDTTWRHYRDETKLFIEES